MSRNSIVCWFASLLVACGSAGSGMTEKGPNGGSSAPVASSVDVDQPDAAPAPVRAISAPVPADPSAPLEPPRHVAPLHIGDVVMFGDSITVGYHDDATPVELLDGYRPETAALLAGEGATFVGNNVGGSPPTDHYQAGSGATIEDQTLNLDRYFGPGLLITHVDVARFALGTNNVNPRPGMGGPADLERIETAMLDLFFSRFPDAAADVYQIPDCGIAANGNADALAFNPTIAAMNVTLATVVAAQRAKGRRVVFEESAHILREDHSSGGVHLGPSGNAKEAVVAAAGIRAAAELQ